MKFDFSIQYIFDGVESLLQSRSTDLQSLYIILDLCEKSKQDCLNYIEKEKIRNHISLDNS